MASNHSARATVLLLSLLAAPAWAQTAPDSFAVDSRAASALTTMTGISAEYCKRGSKPACEFADRLQTATIRLVAAQEACARGMPQGCEAVERGVAELSVVYQRFGRGTNLARTVPGTGTPGR